MRSLQRISSQALRLFLRENLLSFDLLGLREKLLAHLKLLASFSVCKKPIVTDANESMGKSMKEKAADEFQSPECKFHTPALSLVVLAQEGDLALVYVQNAVVGYGNSVGITAEVVKDFLRASKRRF